MASSPAASGSRAPARSYFDRDPADWSFEGYLENVRKTSGDNQYFAIPFNDHKNSYCLRLERRRVAWTRDGQKTLACLAVRALPTASELKALESDFALQGKTHKDKAKTLPYIDATVEGTLRDLTNAQSIAGEIDKKRSAPAHAWLCSDDAKRIAKEDHQWRHACESTEPETGRDSSQSAEPDPEPARGAHSSAQSAEHQPPHDPSKPAAEQATPHQSSLESQIVHVTGSGQTNAHLVQHNLVVLTNDQVSQLAANIVSSLQNREVEVLRESRNREAALVARVLEERERVLEERERRHNLALSAQNLVHNYELEIGRLSVRAKLELVAKDVQWMLWSAHGGSMPRTTTDIFKALRGEFAKYRANGYTAVFSICKALDDTSHEENVPQGALLNVLDTIYARLSGNSHFATTDVLDRNAFTDPKEFLVVRALFRATGIPYAEPTPAAQQLQAALATAPSST